MKKAFKYIKVKDGTISLMETQDFKEVIKNEYGDYYNYDSSDYLFDEDLDIRVFALAGSSFMDLKETIYYEYDGEITDILKGTVIFAKNGKTKWKSLSNKDIRLLKRKLEPTDNNTFTIRYPKKIDYVGEAIV